MKITPPKLFIDCSIQLPGSKSESNRAIIIKALCTDNISLHNLSPATDTTLLQKILATDDKYIDARDAGTTYRFLTSYYALLGKEKLLTGTDRMCQRPIGELVTALKSLGAMIEYKCEKGYPPLLFPLNNIPLRGGKIKMHGHISSQFISSLMLISPYLKNGLVIHLNTPLHSAPYVDMTAQIMRNFGTEVDVHPTKISVFGKPYLGGHYTVESDWSAASFWYLIAALSPHAKIELMGLTKESFQGDSIIQQFMKAFGVQTIFTDYSVIIENNGMILHRTSEPLYFDLKNNPDLAQPLMVLCAAKNLNADFEGIENLRLKETDRIVAMQNELKKLGFSLEKVNLNFELRRVSFNEVKSLSFETYNDHRMAMAFAPLCLLGKPIRISNHEVVSKSYPNFWKDLTVAGFNFIA